MLVTSENRIVEIKLQGDWLFVGFGVKLEDGNVNSFVFRTKVQHSLGELGTHSSLGTNNDKVPCEFLGCDCTYAGLGTNVPFELLKTDEEKFFEYLGSF